MTVRTKTFTPHRTVQEKLERAADKARSWGRTAWRAMNAEPEDDPDDWGRHMTVEFPAWVEKAGRIAAWIILTAAPVIMLCGLIPR